MTLDYSKVWSCLNQLESTSAKICSAREILDCAIEALESGKKEKAETLMYTVDEYLQYYLQDFDNKFKVAWDEIIGKMKGENQDLLDSVLEEKEYYEPSTLSWDDSNLEYLTSNLFTEDRIIDFSETQYTEETLNAMCDTAEKQEKDKVKRWVLPVQENEDEYFIQLPDDLLEQVNWKENDELHWTDNKDGTFTLHKVTKPLKMDEC